MRTEPNGAAPAAGSAVVDEQLVEELVARASAEGVSLTGEGGLLHQLTKRVLESSLEGEMDAHLGYGKHEAAGRDGGNSRNGKRSKTVLTDRTRSPVAGRRRVSCTHMPQLRKPA
jgi:transposase-like protein